MSTKFTVRQIMDWRPCYGRAKVEALVGDGKSATEIGALDILADDRVWALVRALRDAKGLTALCDAAGTFALRAHYHAYYAANAAAYAATYAAAAAHAERAAAYAADAANYVTNAADRAATYAAEAANAADRAATYASERAAQISYLVEAINA